MSIKVEINITNKWLYSLILVFTVFVLGVGVFAYNSSLAPGVLGHSGNEIDVTFKGQTQSLDSVLEIISNKTVVLESNFNKSFNGLNDSLKNLPKGSLSCQTVRKGWGVTPSCATGYSYVSCAGKDDSGYCIIKNCCKII